VVALPLICMSFKGGRELKVCALVVCILSMPGSPPQRAALM